MQTVREIRAHNLVLLQTKYETLARVSELTGVSPSQLSQMKAFLKNPKDKNSRAIGENLARKLEHTLGLPHAWMDQAHSESEPAPLAERMDPPNPAAPNAAIRLSALQSAVLDTGLRLMQAGLISELDSLALLQSWQPLIAQLEHKA
jgi:hypothetical protein